MVKIIGAGIAGLLAGRIMSRSGEVEIFERQPSLPNNHSAVLRFRDSLIGQAVHIPFRQVQTSKGYVPYRNPIADALSYARKCTGVYRTDRSFTPHEIVSRWIAPSDFIERLSEGQKITFGEEFSALGYGPLSDILMPIVSTIPMPTLMDILEYPNKPDFLSVHGFNLVMDCPHTEAYASLYVPSPDHDFNRISLTGSRLTVEYSLPGMEEEDAYSTMMDLNPHDEAYVAAELFGLYFPPQFYASATFKRQTYSKILPIDEVARRKFIHWASDQFNVYSLGRYATWRPKLMLDDLLHDIEIIGKLIGDDYSRMKQRVK